MNMVAACHMRVAIPVDEYVVFVLNEPLTVFEVMDGDANSLVLTGFSIGATTAEGRDYDVE